MLKEKDAGLLMLSIRPKQMAALKQYMLRQFEDRMSSHLLSHFPDRCCEIGEKHVHQLIHRGIERARRYQWISKRDVSRFVILTFVFGENFDIFSACFLASSISDFRWQ